MHLKFIITKFVYRFLSIRFIIDEKIMIYIKIMVFKKHNYYQFYQYIFCNIWIYIINIDNNANKILEDVYV